MPRTLRRTCRRLPTGALALGLLLALVPAAPAETFLVAVAETDDREPSRPPLAAREGIFAALFEADHIAFELPAGAPLPSIAELRRIALEAGAGTIALVVVEWRTEPMPGGALRVRGRGSIVLVDALTGRETPRLPLAVGNEGRERSADRPVLGLQIGSALVEAYRVSSGSR